jgi:hypothetical protein
METGLAHATWGLVVATALLVVATAIPVLGELADRRDKRIRMGAGLIPDMLILRSRLEGADTRLSNARSLSEEDVKRLIKWVNQELEMIYRIITKGDRPSLVFENELYLVQHLLTQAKQRLIIARELTDKTDPDEIRLRDDSLLGARRAYKAALLSLDAATQLLPAKVRTINGESFWDRFSRLSDERESEAGRSFISIKKARSSEDRNIGD